MTDEHRPQQGPCPTRPVDGARRRCDHVAMNVTQLIAGALLGSVAVGVVGCGSSHEPSDPTDAGPASTIDAGEVSPALDGALLPHPDAGPMGDRAGDVWDGYIESYTSPSGSDAVRIVFDSATGDGPRTGIVVFGEGVPPPPPTDPDVGYPPGVEHGIGGDVAGPWEGFEYPIAEASVSGARVRVAVDLGGFYTAWCGLQTPVAQDESGEQYGCLPNTGGGSSAEGCWYNDPITTEPVFVDCGKLFLCSQYQVCDCNAARCTSRPLQTVSFDFRVTGDTGTGSVILGDLHNVHLTRGG